MPQHGNYSTPSKIKTQTAPVPPVETVPELSLEELYKTYYAPYSDLFTTVLKVYRRAWSIITII